MTVRVSDEIVKRYNRFSKILGKSRNQLAARALAEHLEDLELLTKALNRAEKEKEDIPYDQAIKLIEQLRN